jgi:thiol-disulfide isomerase/thioredoxin
MRAARVAHLSLALLLGAGLTAGCSRNDVGASGDQGFVAGKGVITTVAEHDRKAPGAVEGATLGGGHASLAGLRGKVVVVNVWGSWCPPCRAEAPMLAQASRELAGKGVAFLGIDSRDPSEAAAQAFVRQMNIPYPSIYDRSGRTLLAFHGTLAPNSIPSTIVVDKQGRVASSVIGPISRTTLDDLVDDAGAQASS